MLFSIAIKLSLNKCFQHPWQLMKLRLAPDRTPWSFCFRMI